MLNDLQLKKIKDFGIDLDWNGAFDGKSKGNRHLFRIVNKSKEIAKNFDVDLTIIEAAAWLHDTNLEKTVTGDTLANLDKILKLFNDLDIEKNVQEKIIHCIEAHDGRIPAKTIEAKIIHDADTLEKTGPLGIIRETWKRSQIGWNSEQIIEHLKIHIKKRSDRLYTDIARSIADKNNKMLDDFFLIIDEQISEN
ncbi:hypothetical protein C0585_03600 [Candidatus Woesearchaeota archaeon]|nr:MAG: hypothetical protein C0585_03600 [Candidatus Woesearchaeota archaeon]